MNNNQKEYHSHKDHDDEDLAGHNHMGEDLAGEDNTRRDLIRLDMKM